jgi:hypothetical protein
MQKLTPKDVMPPGIREVKIYFIQKGIDEKEAETFFRFYEKRQWKSQRGHALKGWKAIAWSWVRDILSAKPWLYNRKIH